MKKYLLPLVLSTIWLGQMDGSKAQSSHELCNIISSQQATDKDTKQYEIESTVNTFIQDINEQFKDQETITVDSITGAKLLFGEDDFLERMNIVMNNFANVSQNKKDTSDNEKSLMHLSWYVSWRKIWVRGQMLSRKKWSEDAFLYIRDNKDMRWITIFLQYDGKMVAVQLSDEHPIGWSVNNINVYAIKDSSGFNFRKLTGVTTQQDRFANLHTRKTENTTIKESEEFSYQELLEVFQNALNSYSTAK